MSRIGQLLIVIPKGVNINIILYHFTKRLSCKGQTIIVKGQNGILSRKLSSFVRCFFSDCYPTSKRSIYIYRICETIKAKASHGTSRGLLKNMIEGVAVGFKKKLVLKGVGYRAENEQYHNSEDEFSEIKIKLTVGYSHLVELAIPNVLSVIVENSTTVIVSGIANQVVGEFASGIRSVRKPEPYKGKGIAYEGEFIRRKATKVNK